MSHTNGNGTIPTADIPALLMAVGKAVKETREAGISFLPIANDGTKKPTLRSWKELQERQPTEAEMKKWFGSHRGFAFICGAVSGGLELLEFDDLGAYEAYKAAAIRLGYGDLIERIEAGHLVQSPAGGFHWYYYCDEIRGSQKLAERPDPDDPNKRIVLIETRGDRAYGIAAPSGAMVHPSGKPYRLLRGGPKTIATITSEERELLWSLAQTFDEIPATEPGAGAGSPPTRRERVQGDPISPGDDFASRTTWDDLLKKHGFDHVCTHGGTQLWRRPDKAEGWSATVNHGGSDCLYVFSTSTAFKPRTFYSKFAAFTQFSHAGDFKAATKALSRDGYGQYSTWAERDGEWRLETRQNPCPKGTKIVRPGEPPPVKRGGGQATAEPSANGHHQGEGTTTGESDWQAEADRLASEKVKKYGLPTFSNYTWDDKEDDQGEVKSQKVPFSISQLSDQLEVIIGKWPKRVVEMLFCEGAGHAPLYLTSAARLFAWIGRYAQVDWARGSQFITGEQFYEHLRMSAEKYEAIEVLPHYPSIPHLYYMHRPIPNPTGKLDKLLDFYSPMTKVDRELIKAMLLTWFWGGAPGSRPGFQITGPENDPEQGRGLGKSKLMETLSTLVDGYCDVNPSDSIGDTKVRLLSSEARHMRVCRLDNLKAHRFSWGELEGFITAGVISGRMLYVGEGRRPNLLTWVITVNGSSMSKDMAQRLIPIMLARPKFSAAWEETVLEFISDNRWEIVADVLQLLGEEAPVMKPSSRWAAWERDVLSKTDLLAECQAAIKERQGKIDDDEEEADLVREAFRKYLMEGCEANPDTMCVLIPSKTAAEWLSECCRQNYATNKASCHIGTLGIPELSKSRTMAQRGWVWKGKDAKDAEPHNLKVLWKKNSQW